MPHINRIRVNNVKYNFGTQFYDDFIMRFSGKNTIYDLANGGGKSVLMLLLMQNLIPNCTLDEKQPIEKLFRGEGSQVIHSLIEWKLNKNNIKDGYQYMTTGFCARKAKETAQEGGNGGKENAAVEYFNYCIFYREFNDNDLRNLPLSNGKERITYQGLRNYLRDLEKKDFSLEVKIFDRKGDYQRFISQYGLYESEWEIIRGINKTEGHVRTYFETHYKTTRKVVEDLLIEEIIQKSFQNKIGETQDSQEIAQTLLDIKDKLVDLSRKKGEMNHYGLQMEALQSFIQRLHTMKGVYREKSGLEAELSKTYHTAISRRAFKKEQLAKGMEQEEQLQEDQSRLQKQIACVQIQQEEEELNRLEQEAGRTGRLLEQQKENWKKLEERLQKEESGNDYLDYLDDKKRLKIQEETIKGVFKEKESLLAELYELVTAIKKKSAARLEKSEKDLEEASRVCRQHKEQQEVLKEKESDNACKRAVLESKIRENLHQRETLGRLLEEKQKTTGVLLEIHAKERLEENKQRQTEITAEKVRLEKEKEDQAQAMVLGNMQIAEIESKERLTKERQEETKGVLDAYWTDRGRAEHLREIYKEQDDTRILEKIYQGQKENLRKIVELKEKRKAQKQILEALEEKVPMVMTEATRKLAQYISRHHNTKVILGAEYLASKEGFEKDMLLADFPMLPYALIVEKGFSQVVEDMHIRGTDFGNSPIPVLAMEALALEEGLKQEEYLYYVGKQPELFLDENRQKALLEQTEEELEQTEAALEKLKEYEQIFKEDYDFICSFSRDSGKKLQKTQEDFEKYKALLQDLWIEKEALLDSREKTKANQKKTIAALEALEEEGQQVFREAKNLEEIQELLAKQADLLRQAGKLEKALEEEKSEKEKLSTALAEGMDRLENSRRTLQILQERKKEITKNWEVLYGPYEKEGYNGESDLELEELEIRFRGRKEAFEKENSSVEDKQRLADNLRSSMERFQRAIEYRGYSMEEMEKAYEKNQLQRTGKEVLLQRKEQLKELKEAVELTTRTLQGQTEGVNRKFGSISHAKTMVEERFGSYLEVKIEGIAFHDFLTANKQRLLELEGKIKETRKDTRDLERQCFALESMCGDMERMMKSVGITAKETELWDSSISLKEKYEELRDDYEKLAKEEQRRRETFEKDKAKLIETLQKLNAHSFADELKRSLINPVGYAQVEELIGGLTEAVSYIALEKDRIGKGLEDMEVIKNNFENQCLQTCLTIKAELERLPGMSNIQLDGQAVPMIQLQIPYIKEDQYKEAMSAYIDEIVANTEGFSTPEERLRYIRSQLAFKRLFSVIVRDMNGIKLTLYKRERIKEQSRYLKYEEAVGSTGQSQGIYIQFLIAIIHYITSIHSRNADPMALKNVIFIDNPFGAAKDIYIWEPIFKLLKNNNVQLIVPARGATPAITGRFEVNYILGQKLVDGKQQTVVVDYRSQIQEEEIEYKPLVFEQTTLF